MRRDRDAVKEYDRSSVPYPQPSTYSYLIGSELLVHPALHDDENTTSDGAVVKAVFPDVGGEPTVWLDYFKPHDLRRAQRGAHQLQPLRKRPSAESLYYLYIYLSSVL